MLLKNSETPSLAEVIKREIKQIIKDNPNDADLGKAIRKKYQNENISSSN